MCAVRSRTSGLMIPGSVFLAQNVLAPFLGLGYLTCKTRELGQGPNQYIDVLGLASMGF